MDKNYKEYYAAANGYRGFRSYFDEVFKTSDLWHLFILKGGPGTGKSSLMKKLLNSFLKMGYPCDAIYCSSDAKSLDGLIIDKRVAILDGTAPHEIDTRLPGAFDEIVNLGDGWDTEKLKKKRRKIEEINKIKKQNYNSAYKYLSFSGNVHDYKIKTLKKSFHFDEAEKLISNIISPFKTQAKDERKMLISSFSKNGFCRRELLGFELKKIYSVEGKNGENEIFLEALWERVRKQFPLIHFPSPFSDNITEGVLFENESAAFISNFCGGEVINASEYIKSDKLGEIEFLNKTEEA